MTKKIVFLVLMMLSPVLAGAQKVIQMEKEGGVYIIVCKVNGARMRMVFDTGAASVSLSMSMANYLLENDYITKEDIKGKGKSQTADGSIVDHVIINLKDIEIAGLHLKNVEATVISSQNAPLLLGQSAIQKLGPVTISGSRLIVNNVSSKSLSEEEVSQIRDKMSSLWDNRSYQALVTMYSKLKDNNVLDTDELPSYILVCNLAGQFQRTLELVSEWENGPEFAKTEEEVKVAVYEDATAACEELEDYYSMAKYTEKKIASRQLCEITPYTNLSFGMDYYQYAIANEEIYKYSIAIRYYRKSLKEMFSYFKISPAQLYNGSFKDEQIGCILSNYAYCYFKYNNYYESEQEYYLWAGAAKCGDKSALETCAEYGINYRAVRHNPKFDYLFE